MFQITTAYTSDITPMTNLSNVKWQNFPQCVFHSEKSLDRHCEEFFIEMFGNQV